MSFNGKACQEFATFLNNYLASYPDIADLIQDCISTDPVQFYLDASTMDAVLTQVQVQGTYILNLIFKVTRHLCYLLHKLQSELLET